jgi:predicted amidohydrolase YtcJ
MDPVRPQSAAEAAIGDVRFGSKADVTLLNFDVRFTPESGHSPTRSRCLVWADFVAEVRCRLFWSVIPSL